MHGVIKYVIDTLNDCLKRETNRNENRSIHPCIKPGYLARVEVTNRSELMERIEQTIHILEQISERESQLVHIRNDQK